MPASAVLEVPATIGSVLHMRQGHMRSVRLDRDLADPASGRAFVATPFAMTSLSRLLSGAKDGSTDRAWRLTNDYGTGKSTLIMALCRLVAGRTDELPAELRYLAPELRFAPLVSSAIGSRSP